MIQSGTSSTDAGPRIDAKSFLHLDIAVQSAHTCTERFERSNNLRMKFIWKSATASSIRHRSTAQLIIRPLVLSIAAGAT